MFKKAFKTSSNNNVSGKDQKRLIADLSKSFDPESVSALLDKNTTNLTVSKVQGTRISIYTASDLPLLVDASSKGDIYPTLYAYYLFPNLSKCLEVNTGVESFLLSGANLMWPGVRNIKNLGNFNKDDVRYVKTSDEKIFAVGTMACSSQELAAKGASGTAMVIQHIIEDKLWASGPKKVLAPLLAGEQKNSQDAAAQQPGEKIESQGEEKVQEEVKLDEMQARNNKGAESGEDDNNEEEKNEETKEGSEAVPVEVMDEYLMEAFLTSLKISLDDKDLPLDAGEFYSNHLLLCKREGVYIDVRNTSYKKIGKFLQAMAKLNIIDFKEVKKGGAPQITKINRQNPKLLDFAPVVSKVAKKEVKEEEVSEDDKWPKVQISEFFKLKPVIYQFFADDFIKELKEKLYTREEVNSGMQRYLINNNLVDKRLVKLDDPLKPLFWVERPEPTAPQPVKEEEAKKGKQKGKPEPQPINLPRFTILRDEFFKKLEDHLYPYHRVTDLQTGEGDIKHGWFKGITLIAERSHNKKITRVNGLEPFQFNIPSLVNKWQLKFACSVSTHNHTEKGAERTEVIVHGNFLDAIINYLVDECKIERKYISATNKLDKKKK